MQVESYRERKKEAERQRQGDGERKKIINNAVNSGRYRTSSKAEQRPHPSVDFSIRTRTGEDIRELNVKWTNTTSRR